VELLVDPHRIYRTSTRKLMHATPSVASNPNLTQYPYTPIPLALALAIPLYP